MSLTIAAIALFALSSGSQEASPATSVDSTPTQSSQHRFVTKPQSHERVTAFVALIDASDWEGSWNIAGPSFRSEVTSEEWAAQVQPVREPLGQVRSRELVTVQRTSSLPGAPEGEYEVVQYHTQFAGAPTLARETLIMLKTQQGWDVTGYFVQPI